MYDYIKLRIPYSFKNADEQAAFCTRYGLHEVNEVLKIWNNADFKDLTQNRGIYVRLQQKRLEDRSGTVTLSFSLHKFYNLCMIREGLNWDDFTFAKANRAKNLLCKFFPMLDFSQAVVTKYEVGLNVQCSVKPELIMAQIERIVVKGREYRIIEDRSQPENKEFGSHMKNKRIIYNFYDKTYEALSKQKSYKMYYVIPENILRCEKDNHRLSQKTMFFDLFKKEFQQRTRNEFRQRFVSDIFFKEIVPTQVPKIIDGLTRTENKIFNDILMMGQDEVLKALEARYGRGETPRNTYFRRKREIKKVVEQFPELIKKLQETETIFFEEDYKQLVLGKLSML
jgi:hypothetical protein